MKKRIVSVLLTLCMVVALLPTVALATEHTYNGTEKTAKETGDVATVTTSGEKVYYYTDLVAAVNDAQAGDIITLLDDFELKNNSLEFKSAGEVVLNLNGHKIKCTSPATSETGLGHSGLYYANAFIAVSSETQLTIKDESADAASHGQITGTDIEKNGEMYDVLIYVVGSGTLTLESGIIGDENTGITVLTDLGENSSIDNCDEHNCQVVIKNASVISSVASIMCWTGTVTVGGAGLEPTIESSHGAIYTMSGDEEKVSILSGTITGEVCGYQKNCEITGGTFSTDPVAYNGYHYVPDQKLYNTGAYTLKDNGNGTYTVGPKATKVTIDEGATTVTYGDTLALTATKKPTDAINDVTWSSSDENIAKVSEKGVITPVNAGKATITATIDGESDSIEITVIKPTTMTLTPSTTSLEGGGTVTLTLDSGEAAAKDVTVECSDKSITVTDNENGTYTATLPNATVKYTFTATLDSECYTAKDATADVSVTRYVAATTTTTTTTNKTETTTETLPAETDETANTQVGEEEPAVEVVSTETVTDEETGTVTTTTEKSDGSTTVVEAQTDGTLTTTDTAATGVQIVTVEAPSQQVKATVTIPEEVKSAVVTIPVAGELTAGMVAMDADTGEIIMLSALTEDGLALKLDGSKNIVIVDNSKDFEDVPENNWVTDGIDYATAHNLFGGTSETTFDPDGDMTRAMLMTVLARFEGIDTDLGATWYEAGMNWAVENSISDGSDPNGSITREQLATMLYRYAGSPAVDGAASGFTDSHEISSYAADAMVWAIQTGILTGNTRGELNPTATATRGQVATMMMRFGQSQVQ
jgi:hypothetical protein